MILRDLWLFAPLWNRAYARCLARSGYIGHAFDMTSEARPGRGRRVPRPTGPAAAPTALVGALEQLGETVRAARYPLELPDAAQARAATGRLLAQLDDYLIPRLSRLDAPLLVVVGGSTGAGKSTLVNSIVRAPVSQAGVLRPTTRSPVLVSHPGDAAWFTERRLLPGLNRSTGLEPGEGGGLRLIAAPALPQGLALLDAPDIDSVVDANRILAGQLLDAADLWLFVTTAARYADAVPWRVLRSARDRGAVVALVLDRVPEGAEDDVGGHFAEMLDREQLTGANLFVLPEVALDGQGLLAEALVEPLRSWLAGLAADAGARAEVVRQTVDGAVAATGAAAAQLASAADQQVAVVATLEAVVDKAYSDALATVEEAASDGTLLRGEVLARWQEFVGTGEFMKALQTRVGRLRDRVTASFMGRPAPVRHFQDALTTGLVGLIREAGAQAAEDSYAAWHAHPAGPALLRDDLREPAPDLPERALRLVRDWQRGVLELVRVEGADRRRLAKISSYAVNASGLLVMLAVFASTSFIPTGLELAVAGGTTVAGQKVLEAVFGDQAMRDLAGTARADLIRRVHDLLAGEADRYTELLAGVDAEPGIGDRLRAAVDAVETARATAGLGAKPGKRPLGRRPAAAGPSAGAEPTAGGVAG